MSEISGCKCMYKTGDSGRETGVVQLTFYHQKPYAICLTLNMRAVLLPFFLFIACALHAQRIQYDCRGCTLTVDEKHRIQKVAEYETAFFDDVFGPRRRQTIRIRYYSDEKKFRQGQRT